MMSGIQKIGEHAVQIKIHKARPIFEEERVAEEHFFKRQQALREAVEQPRLLVPPLIQALASEFSLLVPNEGTPFGFGDELPPVSVVEFEAVPFWLQLILLPRSSPEWKKTCLTLLGHWRK
jgi:hypothetical protein